MNTYDAVMRALRIEQEIHDQLSEQQRVRMTPAVNAALVHAAALIQAANMIDDRIEAIRLDMP